MKPLIDVMAMWSDDMLLWIYISFSLGMGFYDVMTDGSMNRWCCPLLHILINGKS